MNKVDLVILRSVVTGSRGETVAHTCLQDDPLLEKQVVHHLRASEGIKELMLFLTRPVTVGHHTLDIDYR